MDIDKKLTVSYLKEGYKTGRFTPKQICEEIVKRAYDTLDMNIWIVKPDMELMTPYIDALCIEDINSKPLWGIPFAIKDNIDLENVCTTAACDAYRYMPEKSATVVELLIKAGAIPVGKTNLDQFATGLVGTRSPYGETHNALDGDMISGGSSSGSAVSVAMGQAVFALGTDTAGSGRVPAALNNIIGYKPSLGAWSTKGVVPACASLDCVTVFANNLDDIKAVDSVVRRFDRDCQWSKHFEAVSDRLPKAVLIPDGEITFYGDYGNEYRACWDNAVRVAKELGIPVEKVDYSIFAEAASILYDGPWIAERWSSLGEFVENSSDGSLVPVTEKILRSGNKENLTADSVFKAMHRLADIKCEVKKLLEDKILLMPTAGGTYTRQQVDDDPVRTNSNMGLYTNHCNLLDLCALAFRAGFAGEKLPFGVTAFALSGNEGLNQSFAKLFEKLIDAKKIPIAVCGLHMRGFELEYQLKELSATYVEDRKTAASYRLYRLPTTPAKPGMIRVNEGGAGIDVEIWKIPAYNLGRFLNNISAPLGLGRITLEDGEQVIGFICEGCAKDYGEDITNFGGWKKACGSI